MSQWKTHLGFPETQGTYGFLLVLTIDALGSGVYLPLSILYFQVTTGFSLPIIGLTLTIATICTLPLTLLTGSLVDRFGARRLTASSQLIEAIGLLGYLFVHTVPILFLMASLVTGGTRIFYAARTALVVEIASPHQRDRWYGLSGAIRNVGLGMGGASYTIQESGEYWVRILSTSEFVIPQVSFDRLSEPGLNPRPPFTPFVMYEPGGFAVFELQPQRRRRR